MGLREGLGKAPGLLLVQPAGVAHDKAALFPEDDLCGLERDEAGEAVVVDDLVAVPCNGEELRVVRRRQRADEVQWYAVEGLVVVVGVLPGVIDDGEERTGTGTGTGTGQKRREAGDELAHHCPGLGDIGLAARIGVGDERDATVGRDDQSEPADAQVASLLPGVSPHRDRGTAVSRVDPGGEVRHVEHEAREADLEPLDHARDDPALDLLQLGLADRVHRLPEATVVERARCKAEPPVTGGLVPPVGEGELRAGIDHAVEGRERDVGPGRGPGISSTSTDDLIHDLGDAKTTQHLPHCGDVAEGEVTRTVRFTWSRLGQPGGDLLGRAEVALGDDPGLALYPGGLGQVVAGLPVLLLADDE